MVIFYKFKIDSKIIFGVFVCLKASSLSRNAAPKSSFVGNQNYLSEKIKG